MNTLTAVATEQRVIDAFSHYVAAHAELATALGEFDPNSTFPQQYPFTGCFDKLLDKVKTWEQSIVETFEGHNTPKAHKEPPAHEGWKVVDVKKNPLYFCVQFGLTLADFDTATNDPITHIYASKQGHFIFFHDTTGWYSSVAVNDSFYTPDFYEVVTGIEKALGIVITDKHIPAHFQELQGHFINKWTAQERRIIYRGYIISNDLADDSKSLSDGEIFDFVKSEIDSEDYGQYLQAGNLLTPTEPANNPQFISDEIASTQDGKKLKEDCRFSKFMLECIEYNTQGYGNNKTVNVDDLVSDFEYMISELKRAAEKLKV